MIALSQLSRAVESREDKRPMLSDLRESGSIEQDADEVLFVYRDEYYLQNAEPKRTDKEKDDAYAIRVAQWHTKMEAARDQAEVIVAKHRHGPVGTRKFQFDAQFTRFSDIADEPAQGAFV